MYCFYGYCWSFYFRAYFICIITSWLFTFDLLGNSCFLSMFCSSGYNTKSFAMYTQMTFQCLSKNDKRILNSLVTIKLLSSCLQLTGFVNVGIGQRFFPFPVFYCGISVQKCLYLTLISSRTLLIIHWSFRWSPLFEECLFCLLTFTGDLLGVNCVASLLQVGIDEIIGLPSRIPAWTPCCKSLDCPGFSEPAGFAC